MGCTSSTEATGESGVRSNGVGKRDIVGPNQSAPRKPQATAAKEADAAASEAQAAAQRAKAEAEKRAQEELEAARRRTAAQEAEQKLRQEAEERQRQEEQAAAEAAAQQAAAEQDAAAQNGEQAQEADGEPVIDWDQAMEQCCGEEDFLLEVLGDMLAEREESLVTLHDAWQNDLHKELSEQAHSVKGAAANLFLLSLKKAALETEQLGKALVKDPENEENLAKREGVVKDMVRQYKRIEEWIAREGLDVPLDEPSQYY